MIKYSEIYLARDRERDLEILSDNNENECP